MCMYILKWNYKFSGRSLVIFLNKSLQLSIGMARIFSDYLNKKVTAITLWPNYKVHTIQILKPEPKAPENMPLLTKLSSNGYLTLLSSSFIHLEVVIKIQTSPTPLSSYKHPIKQCIWKVLYNTVYRRSTFTAGISSNFLLTKPSSIICVTSNALFNCISLALYLLLAFWLQGETDPVQSGPDSMADTRTNHQASPNWGAGYCVYAELW